MRGDLQVLARLSRSDRRANRVQRRLDRRLRKREARRGVVRPPAVMAWRCTHEIFARAPSEPSKDAYRHVRRLLRSGHYHAAELGGGLEHVGWGSVASPCAAEASLGAAVEVATKLPHSFRFSGPLPLLRTEAALPDDFLFGHDGVSCGVDVLVARPAGVPICLLVASDAAADAACPLELGLDVGGFAELQAAAARLLNLRLEQ